MKEIYKESMIKVPENQTLIVASALCGESFCLGVWGKGLYCNVYKSIDITNVKRACVSAGCPNQCICTQLNSFSI